MTNTGRRKNIFELAEVAAGIISNEGWTSFFRVFSSWLSDMATYISGDFTGACLRRFNAHPSFKDILFINGCTLNHPTRYRVDHQIEQLEFNGLTCDSTWYENISLNTIKNYHAFVIFRCPLTPVLKQFIATAKRCNKKVFYDIDDLVIDKKYVKTIKYLETMPRFEFGLYMEGVTRMRETMLLCDYVITSTQVLAQEIRTFGKEVFVNRNVASETIVLLSEKALKKISSRHSSRRSIYIGYLSGSITHNEDFESIVPVLTRILKEHPETYLVICGLVDVPKALNDYKKQLIIKPFIDWKKLPALIATLDINLAPLEQSIFNEAKSENKWTEAALLKVLTIAGRTGAFADIIEDGQTGLLCSDDDEWYEKLGKAIGDENYRTRLANNAYHKVMKEHITAYTGKPLADFISSKLSPSLGLVVPGTRVSGGINVLMRHYRILRGHGYDVTMLSDVAVSHGNMANAGEIDIVSIPKIKIEAYFEKLVASMWTTRAFVDSYDRVNKRYYLVQNFETDFNIFGSKCRLIANSTYGDFPPNINYITISRWCQHWLKERFGKESRYAPNGIDLELFKYAPRDFDGKIRILVEGDSNSYYKNVDESFKIAGLLDRDQYEIWYLSNIGKPKSRYKVDRFFNNVPYGEVAAIYQQCHILVKSSILESFSYPPLEMMATGGIAIVAPNGGNREYLRDGENCLMYEPGNVGQAVKLIHQVIQDEELRGRLIGGGLKTAQTRSWNDLTDEILKLYE